MKTLVQSMQDRHVQSLTLGSKEEPPWSDSAVSHLNHTGAASDLPRRSDLPDHPCVCSLIYGNPISGHKRLCK